MLRLNRFSIGRALTVVLFCSLPGYILRAENLRTRETVLSVRAGATEPELVSLQSPDHAAWRNLLPESPISSAEVDGRIIHLQWRLVPSASHSDAQTISYVYETEAPHLRLTWEWRAPASTGPIEHRIHIQNLGTTDVWIPLQPSCRFDWSVHANEALNQTYIDKGAGRPSAVGTHQVAVPAGYAWEGRSSTYATDEGPREIIPWFMVERGGDDGDGWYVGVEFSGRSSLTLQRDATSLHGTVGLNPDPGPYRTRLHPGESFDAPPVFVGAFTGGLDGMGNVLRPWVRQVLTNPGTWEKPDYPLLVNNTWGSGMDVGEALAKRMIADSSDLGLEMLHIDAGWFRGVGDWYPDPKKFPDGLAAIADEAHRRGLKVGLWVNWAQAGVDTEPGALNVHDPKVRDWLVADVPPGWKPDAFVGRTTDIGVPAVREHVQAELDRIVSSYKLDMLEHDGYLVARNCSRTDHPHAPSPGGTATIVSGSGIAMPDEPNSTDVSYRATRSYYAIYSQLRRQHPGLLLEICNDGGRMVDFGSASHGDYFSITDSYDPLSNRQAFYNASHVLPAAMLEDYVEKWPAARIENFRYMLRSGMMGWLSVMQDTSRWTPEQRADAKGEFALYKQKLRPFIRDADIYHISARPDGVHWDGIEYCDVKRDSGVVYAFRGSARNEPSHTFPIRGLNANRRYRLHFHDGSSPDRTESGRALLGHGLDVVLSVPDSSELIFIDAVK